MGKYQKFDRIAAVEFGDIIVSSEDLGHKLRIYLKDKTFIDLYLSVTIKTTRFSIHWERRHQKKGFYRLDNTPDPDWKKIESFPLHFHFGTYRKVKASPFHGKTVTEYFRQFLTWVKQNF